MDENDGKYFLCKNSCSLPVLNPPGPSLTSNYQPRIGEKRNLIQLMKKYLIEATVKPPSAPPVPCHLSSPGDCS